MKVFVALLVVVCALSINAKGIQKVRNPKSLNNAIAQAITMAMAHKMYEKNARSPVLPEFEDPLEVENAELDLSALELEGITGNVALREGQVTGLSTVWDDLAIALTIPARITYLLRTGVLRAFGEYEAHVDIDNEEGLANFEGAGRLDAEVTNPDLQAIVRIIVNLITNRFTVTSVEIPRLEFESVKGEAQGLTFNGELVDWDAVNEDAKPVFDEFWAENRATIETAVRDLLRDLLKDCKITDLIGGDYSCIALPESKVKTRTRLVKEALRYLA